MFCRSNSSNSNKTSPLLRSTKIDAAVQWLICKLNTLTTPKKVLCLLFSVPLVCLLLSATLSQVIPQRSH